MKKIKKWKFFYETKQLKVKTAECRLQLAWDEVVSAIISLVNNQYSCLVELLNVSTVMILQKKLVKKSLLLLISSDSKMQNRK